MKRPYKEYRFLGLRRVKGPGGLDIYPNCGCAGCFALYMNIAYEAGCKSALQKKKRKT